jgi:general secretion pathway protein J
MTRPHATSGFTLLEVLVVLVVCGLLFAGLTQGLHAVLHFADRQRALAEATDDLDSVDRTLRTLFEQMEPSGRTDPYQIAGNASSLRFITRLPAPAGPPQRSEVLLRVDAQHRLVLTWAPSPHVIAPPALPTESILLHGGGRIAITYRAPDPATPWRTTWQGRDPPLLIRLHIEFAPGDPRDWPDIVTAPMLVRGPY